MFFYLLTVAVCIAYCILLLAYLYGWQKTSVRTLQSAPVILNPPIQVSIIIAARNEENNILNCLDSIFKQTFPATGFEVILVNDHSTDLTAKLVESLRYPNFKLIHLSETRAGKKQAISEGIKNATGNLIVTTDADCEMGENWLSSLVAFYKEKNPKMIVAPVLVKNEIAIQQIIQSQELLVFATCTCGSLFWNRPILCSGANLIYEKSAFLAVNGYDGFEKTATGDDMFLMLKINEKYPGKISYLKSKEAVVFTKAERSSSGALYQRKRWASKTFSYGLSHVTGVAMLIFFTNFLILISGIMSVINLKFVLIPVACLLSKFLVDFMLLYSASSFFEKKTNPVIFSVASLLYPIYVSIMGLISPFTKYSWKSRKS